MASERQGKHWTEDEIRALRQLASSNTPARAIGSRLQRSPDAVRSQAMKWGIRLWPSRRPPDAAPAGQAPEGEFRA